MLAVRAATLGDSASLIALQRRCPQGEGLVVQAVNTPDFFARARAYQTHGVLLAHDGDRVVGSAAYGTRRALIAGMPRRIGYEFQYFTDPAWRGRGVAQALRAQVEQQLRAAGTVLSYGLVVAGNQPSIRLLEGQGFHAHRELDLSVFLPYKPMAVQGVVRPLGLRDLDAVARLREAAWGACDWYEPLSGRDLSELVERLPGFSVEDLRGLEVEGELVACAGIWDNSRLMEVTVERLSIQLRAVGLALDALRLVRPMPRMVQPGALMRQWILILTGFHQPAHLTPIFYQINNEALRRQADQIMLLSERSQPLSPRGNGLFRAGTKQTLYVKQFEPLPWGQQPVHIDGIDL